MPLYLLQAMVGSIALVVMVAGLYVTLVWYVDAVEYPSARRYLTKFLVGSAHFLAHLVAMFTLSLYVVMLDNRITPPIERALDAVYSSRKDQAPIVKDVIEESLKPLKDRQAEVAAGQTAPQRERQPAPIREVVGLMSYPILMIGLGGLVGGSLWGLYWVLTGLFARMHAEDAFAALRIKNYKNFLRLKFEQDKLTIYPLGVDKIATADDWENAPRGQANPLPNNPQLVAVKPIDVRLIENPILITVNDAIAD
jgi:hypothetical protein